jgi:hypothetical protein
MTKHEPELGQSEQATIDHVIEVTKPLNFREFIRLVYPAYPITSSNRYDSSNLEELAQAYTSQRYSRMKLD